MKTLKLFEKKQRKSKQQDALPADNVEPQPSTSKRKVSKYQVPHAVQLGIIEPQASTLTDEIQINKKPKFKLYLIISDDERSDESPPSLVTAHTPSHQSPCSPATQHAPSDQSLPSPATAHAPTHESPPSPATANVPSHQSPHSLATAHTPSHQSPPSLVTAHAPSHQSPPSPAAANAASHDPHENVIPTAESLPTATTTVTSSVYATGQITVDASVHDGVASTVTSVGCVDMSISVRDVSGVDTSVGNRSSLDVSATSVCNWEFCSC